MEDFVLLEIIKLHIIHCQPLRAEGLSAHMAPTAWDRAWHTVGAQKMLTEQKCHLMTHQAPPACRGIEVTNRQTQCLLVQPPLSEVTSSKKDLAQNHLKNRPRRWPVRKDMNTGGL